MLDRDDADEELTTRPLWVLLLLFLLLVLLMHAVREHHQDCASQEGRWDGATCVEKDR
jgi:hypothetical protein